MNVALPSIRTGLHASSASLEWIVSGYALAYGLALVPGGRAGDRFGHKRLFLIGLTIFTLASVACGISQTQGEIVSARIVQGLGAGLFFPSISATIQHAFTGPARSRERVAERLADPDQAGVAAWASPGHGVRARESGRQPAWVTMPIRPRSAARPCRRRRN